MTSRSSVAGAAPSSDMVAAASATALGHAGNIVGAAELLGITRHALKRRIVKLGIPWSRNGVVGPGPLE